MHLEPDRDRKAAGGGGGADLPSRLLCVRLDVCYGVALVRRYDLHCWVWPGSVVALARGDCLLDSFGVKLLPVGEVVREQRCWVMNQLMGVVEERRVG